MADVQEITTAMEASTVAVQWPASAPIAAAPAPASASAVPVAAPSGDKKKVLHLVVDSGAIIKGTNLAPLAENFWTVPDVLAEIRDKRARAILETLPFTLQTREPSAEAMKAVANFSRKTGDFASLSLTDLRVMALTYMLEVEQHGSSDHLKESPEMTATVTRDANGRIVSGAQYPCKFFGTSMGCKYGDECKFIHDPSLVPADGAGDADAEKRKVAIPCKFFATPEGCKNGDACPFVHEQEPADDAAQGDDDAAEFSEPVPDAILRADVKSRILGGFGSSSNAGAADDDGKNWINTMNMVDFKGSMFGDGKNVEALRHEIAVACITTDFSMQNVMLQIGLRQLSTDGMLIKRVKQWILKCIACFTTTTEMARMFCPKCGNNTLERVSYSIGQDGQMVFYHRANRPTKLTGTKFSLPKPKGGRQGDLLLREDQLMMGIWGQRQRQHHKVMQSAFGENVAHDLGVKAEKQTSLVVGYGRMNPNAQKGRERRGKKKRN
jgi:RNA-binding protein NOB1